MITSWRFLLENKSCVCATIQRIARSYLICSFKEKIIYIHCSYISNKFINDLNDFFKLNERITVQIINYDPKSAKYVGVYNTINKENNRTERMIPQQTINGFKILKENTIKLAQKIVINNIKIKQL